MPSSACANQLSCLARRSEIFRKPAVFTWDSECGCCIEGTARAMNTHKPEPDVEPQPQRDAGKRKKKYENKCACGSEIERRATQCKKCWGLSRRVNHAKCSMTGCRAKARRLGLCCTHYFKAQGEERLARKREKQKEATRKYREKAHAIVEYRLAVKEKMEKEGE